MLALRRHSISEEALSGFSLLTGDQQVNNAMPSSQKAPAQWNAGNLGCGELIAELARQIRSIKPDALLEVTAVDSGAPEDIPAWCRMTGHVLEKSAHPLYLIRRRSDKKR